MATFLLLRALNISIYYLFFSQFCDFPLTFSSYSRKCGWNCATNSPNIPLRYRFPYHPLPPSFPLNLCVILPLNSSVFPTRTIREEFSLFPFVSSAWCWIFALPLCQSVPIDILNFLLYRSWSTLSLNNFCLILTPLVFHVVFFYQQNPFRFFRFLQNVD